MFLLVQADARALPKLPLSAELDHSLCVLRGVHHDGVQVTARGGHGHVVLLLDGPEVPQPAVHALQPAGLGLLVDGPDEPAAVVLLLVLVLRLRGLRLHGQDLAAELLDLRARRLQLLPALADQPQRVRLPLGRLLGVLLSGSERLAALLVLPLDLLDLLGDPFGLLPYEIGLRLRHVDDLADLGELLLDGHQLGLLGLLQGPQLFRLAL
mmetsp:Transcript_51517/g.134080  ORF Transcript_51517/g.134080 Transcript_51517/m.134080 type:complete len:210 (+) Transcript_51517:1970-2599(+)